MMPQTRAIESSRLDAGGLSLAKEHATAWQNAMMKKKKISMKAQDAGRSLYVHISTMTISNMASHAKGVDLSNLFISSVRYEPP